MWIEIAGGLVLGSALGWALQRGGFCMNSAFRSIIFDRDKSLLRSWLLILAINIPAVTLLTQLGILRPDIAPLFWPALLAGGFVFGLGMVIAGGCASGTIYRSARGMLGSWAALAGFLAGSAAIDGGLLSGLRIGLRSRTVEIDGRVPDLFMLTGMEAVWQQWLLIALLLAPLIWYLARAPKQKFLTGWGWKTTGVVIGLLALATWLLSAFLGRNFGLSYTQPAGALVDLWVMGEGSGIGLPFYMLVGTVLGSFFSAWVRGETGWSLPPAPALVRQGSGGMLMGFGAALAGGCNIGHGVSGLATLGLGSILGVISIMAGCWVSTALIIASEKRVRAAAAA